MLTYEKLMGMWNGLTTPWTQKGTLDADAFQHNINRCVKAGSPGIYTGGGTNEFYAQDFDLFRELTDILLDTLKGTGVPNQIGISALTTDEIVKRGRYAIEKGADALQVTFPFWTRLREIEAVDFYKDLYQEFRPYPIIHFDTEFNKHMLNRDLLGKMKNACPTLIGVKFDDSDLDRFADMALNFPDISFFVPENLLAAAFPLGARGCYSAYANANPYFMKRYFEYCTAGRLYEANEIQRKYYLFLQCLGVKGPNDDTEGYSDAAYDKAIIAVTGFLTDTLIAKKPYRSFTSLQIKQIREWLETNAPDFLEFPEGAL